MNTPTNHTIVYQGDKPAFVVIPYDEYQRWLDDHTYIPHDVVKLTTQYNCNLLGAWRRYRGLTQNQLAEEMGVSQSAIAQMEKTDNPHSKTLEKAAAILQCEVDQLTD